MSEHVLETIESPQLKLYAVWEPMLRADDERWARKSSTLLDDPRVEHFWIGSQEVGEAFQEPLALLTEPAWDVYLLYPRGAKWETASPPKPETFMHQLGGRLPKDKRLDGKRLGARVRAMFERR